MIPIIQSLSIKLLLSNQVTSKDSLSLSCTSLCPFPGYFQAFAALELRRAVEVSVPARRQQEFYTAGAREAVEPWPGRW